MRLNKENIKSFLSGNHLLLSKVFTSFYNISDFLNVSEYGAMFCPFHDDKNKPSAKFFKDDDGVERIYCYAERKQFTSYDYVKKVLGKDPLFTLLQDYELSDIIEVTQELLDTSTLLLKKSRLKDINFKNLSILDFVDLISFGEKKL